MLLGQKRGKILSSMRVHYERTRCASCQIGITGGPRHLPGRLLRDPTHPDGGVGDFFPTLFGKFMICPCLFWYHFFCHFFTLETILFALLNYFVVFWGFREKLKDRFSPDRILEKSSWNKNTVLLHAGAAACCMPTLLLATAPCLLMLHLHPKLLGPARLVRVCPVYLNHHKQLAAKIYPKSPSASK
jgi:hypothetical protein